MEQKKPQAKGLVTSEEEHQAAVSDALYALWQNAQQKAPKEGEGTAELDGKNEGKQDLIAGPSSPAEPESLRNRFTDSFEGQTPQQIRKILNSVLTTLEYDPSEPLMDTIDAILRFEQRDKTFVDSMSIPGHTFYKDDRSTNCKVAYWQVQQAMNEVFLNFVK